jgi:uncharacterized membrane protein YvlD (DUF360 family)
MKWKEVIKRFGQEAKPVAEKTWLFLRETFSDKKNIVRFAFAALAVIVAASLMPGIGIASFWVAFLLVLVMIALLIGARPALEYIKLPFTPLYFGLFLWLAGWLVLLFLDWILWYFEPVNVWWVLLYCLIQAVFNCIIENLIQEE